MKRLIMLSMVFVSLCPTVYAEGIHLTGQTIIVCGDGAEWPPYVYFKRDTKGNKTEEITGYSVDMLNIILEEKQIHARIVLVPWKRCLLGAQRGQDYHLVLDASYSVERAREYVMTASHYAMTPKYFYAKKNYPNGFPPIESIAELFNVGEICGLFAYNYEGFADGLSNENIKKGTKTFAAVVKKTLAGGCNAFLARYEALVGFAALGEDYLRGGEIAHRDLPDARPDKYYMLISRKYKYAYELKGIIDEGIDTLRRSGKLDELRGKYSVNPCQQGR